MAGQNTLNLWCTIPSLLFCQNTLPSWRCGTSLTLRQCISLVHKKTIQINFNLLIFLLVI